MPDSGLSLENFSCKDLPLNTSPPSMTGEMSHQHHAANQRQQRQHGFSDQQNNLPEDQIRVIDNTVIKMQPSGEHARQSTGQRHTAKPDNTNAHQQNQQ